MSRRGRHEGEAAHGLAFLEENIAEDGHRTGMAALTGLVQPLLGLLHIRRTALARQHHLRELELRLGDAKGRCDLEIELACLIEVDLDRAVRNTGLVIIGEREQRVDKKPVSSEPGSTPCWAISL